MIRDIPWKRYRRNNDQTPFKMYKKERNGQSKMSSDEHVEYER